MRKERGGLVLEAGPSQMCSAATPSLVHPSASPSRVSHQGAPSNSQLQTFPSSPAPLSPLCRLPQSLPAARKTKVLTSEAETRRRPLYVPGPEGLNTRKKPNPRPVCSRPGDWRSLCCSPGWQVEWGPGECLHL